MQIKKIAISLGFLLLGCSVLADDIDIQYPVPQNPSYKIAISSTGFQGGTPVSCGVNGAIWSQALSIGPISSGVNFDVPLTWTLEPASLFRQCTPSSLANLAAAQPQPATFSSSGSLTYLTNDNFSFAFVADISVLDGQSFNVAANTFTFKQCFASNANKFIINCCFTTDPVNGCPSSVSNKK